MTSVSLPPTVPVAVICVLPSVEVADQFQLVPSGELNNRYVTPEPIVNFLVVSLAVSCSEVRSAWALEKCSTSTTSPGASGLVWVMLVPDFVKLIEPLAGTDCREPLTDDVP